MPAVQTTLLECDDAHHESRELEQFTLIDVVNESIRVNKASLHRSGVHVVRHFHALPTILGARHKMLQILSTLIATVDQSIRKLGRREAKLTIRVETGGDQVSIEIETDRVVVPPDDLLNSFGPDNGQPEIDSSSRLHHSARMAKELGGRLTELSAGAGAAASYRLELPLSEKGGGNG